MKFLFFFVLVASAALGTQAFIGFEDTRTTTASSGQTGISGNDWSGSAFASICSILGIDIPNFTEGLSFSGSLHFDPVDIIGSIIWYQAGTLGDAFNTILTHALDPTGASTSLDKDAFMIDVITDWCKAAFSIIVKAELQILGFDDITIANIIHPIGSNLGMNIKCVPGGLSMDAYYPPNILENTLSKYVHSSDILVIESAIGRIIHICRVCAIW